MATLTYLTETFTVDHAVKGADYIHGYDADNNCVVSFDGVVDFSGFTYDGTYMSPEECLNEPCNIVKNVNGMMVKADGTPATTGRVVTVTLKSNAWTGTESPFIQAVSLSGIYANSKVDLQPNAVALAALAADGVTSLYIANNNGALAAYAIGDCPTVALSLQATITEVDV